MNEEQRQTATPSPALRACLNRLKEMGVQVDKPIYALTWYDVARVMVETEGFEKAANLPTDVLVHTLNTVQDGLEYLDWYDNIQKRKFTLTCSQQDWPNATHEELWQRWLALSPREKDVTAFTCLGYTNRQITAKLRVSPDTVKGYVRQVLIKFQLHSKAVAERRNDPSLQALGVRRYPRWSVIRGSLHTGPQYSQSGLLGRRMAFYFQRQPKGSSAKNAKPTPDRLKLSVRRFLLGKVFKVQLV